MQRTKTSLFLDQRSENEQVLWCKYEVYSQPNTAEPKWWGISWEYELPFGLGIRKSRYAICGSERRAIEILDTLERLAKELHTARENDPR
jgi:hypothetical protein